MEDIKQQDFVKAELVGSATMLEHNSAALPSTPDNLPWFHRTRQKSRYSHSYDVIPQGILSLEIGHEYYSSIKLLHTSACSGEYCHVPRAPQQGCSPSALDLPICAHSNILDLSVELNDGLWSNHDRFSRIVWLMAVV